MEQPLPKRRSIRKKGWDYTSAGCYFVTINAHGRRAVFGTVVNGRMVPSAAGRIAAQAWCRSATPRADIALDEFVVMPDHVHGIVWLKAKACEPGGRSGAVGQEQQFGKPVTGSLGVFVAAYKAAVTREVHRAGLMHQAVTTRAVGPATDNAFWQRNYWDRVVQDNRALAAVRGYIRFNPQNHEAVMRVGEPRHLGNRALLALPKAGFMASRGAETPHGRLPLKPGEAIISGFLSPMEQAVFRAGLEQRRPLVWVVPHGMGRAGLMHQAPTTHDAPMMRDTMHDAPMTHDAPMMRDTMHGAPMTHDAPMMRDAMRNDPAICRALDEGRLLILSPFDEAVEAPSVRRAAWCNHYVLTHCSRMIVGHLNPSGLLACVLSEADPEMEIVYL